MTNFRLTMELISCVLGDQNPLSWIILQKSRLMSSGFVQSCCTPPTLSWRHEEPRISVLAILELVFICVWAWPSGDLGVSPVAPGWGAITFPLNVNGHVYNRQNTHKIRAEFLLSYISKSVEKRGVGKWTISQHPMTLIPMDHGIKARTHARWQIT